MKKFTLEDIRNIFLENNCILLEETYSNNQQPLKFICSCGKEDVKHLISYQKTKKCRYCNRQNQDNLRRNSLEKVKSFFEEHGCVFLNDEYKNNIQPLDFVCSCGRKDSKCFESFKLNPQCRYCSGKALDFDTVKKTFEDNNCILLENNFKTCKELMRFKCYCGKEDSKAFNDFKKSPKCRTCSKNDRLKIRTKSFDEVKYIFESKGNQLLSKEYIPKKKLEYICDCGNIDYKIIHKFIAGERCKECGLKRCSKSRRHSQEDVENLFKDNGCKLLSVYTGDEQKLEFICKCGKKATTTYHTFKRCKNCWECGKKKHTISKEQVSKFINENNLELISFHTFEKSNKGKLLLRCKCGNDYERTWNYLRSGKGNNACVDCSMKLRSEKFIGENHPSWIKDRSRVEFRKHYAKKIYSMLRRCYSKFKCQKENKSYDFLGYSHYDLGLHITNHPNYQNAIKNNQMQIDHIFPIQAFIDFGLCDIEHIKVINSLENLQPLDAFDNSSKNDKYDKEKFIDFLKSKGLY